MATPSRNSPDTTNEGNRPIEGFETRPANAGDAEAVCRLFGKIFPDQMTLAHWHWKYDRAQSRAIVVYQNGELVAHYGGVGTDILMNGTRSTAIQVTDLMVDHKARHAVRSQSPFYLSAKMFLESYAGYDNPFYLGYGFPSERAMGLSEKLGLFEPVGRMHEVTWQVHGRERKAGSTIVEVKTSNIAGLVTKIDWLWDRFSRNFNHHFVCIKNAGFIRWRYLEHPAKTYKVYLVSGKIFNRPKYLLVMRHDQHRSMLMDVLGKSTDMEPVISLAKQIAAEEGNGTLVTWCSDTFRKVFTVGGSTEKPLPIAIPANTGSPGLPAIEQKGKWWFMPGDTDYL